MPYCILWTAGILLQLDEGRTVERRLPFGAIADVRCLGLPAGFFATTACGKSQFPVNS